MRNLLLGSFVGLLVGALGFVGLRAAGLVGAPAPAVEVPPPPPPPPVEPEPFAARAAAEKERLNPVYEDVLYVRGYVARGHRVNVLLSDGSVISEDVKELRQVSRTHVELAGKRYALRCFVPVSSEAAPGQPAGNGQRADVPGESGQVSSVSASAASDRAGTADEGAWARGPDGVARLKEKQTIGR